VHWLRAPELADALRTAACAFHSGHLAPWPATPLAAASQRLGTAGHANADAAATTIAIRMSPLVAETVRHLHQAWASRIRIGCVAQRLGISVFRLIRQFRREVGLTPFAYLHQVRINHAGAMLRAGESITGAAYACGFSDQSHLTRAFRRQFGVPPGVFARTHAHPPLRVRVG
jgi:AraC-like DNA-binding protein